MASDDEAKRRDTAGSEDAPCMACRGSGQVISNLGGSPHEVQCPWCDGSGTRLRDHDAQAHWDGERSASQPAAEARADRDEVVDAQRD